MNPTDNGTGRERAGVGVAVAVTGRPGPSSWMPLGGAVGGGN